MDQTERFVTDANISRFVAMLRNEADPGRQKMLRRLLIEEANRFGTMAERLTMAERYSRDGESHISKLAAIVHEMKGNGLDCTRTERTLQLSMMIQELFEEFRSTLLNGIEQRQL
jgi:hypothetical protein